MAKRRVGVLEAFELPTSVTAQTFCGRGIAERLVATREARRIGKRLIQMVRMKAADAIKQAKAARDAIQKAMRKEIQLMLFWDGPLGRGNVLPFAKPRSSGDKLHYEMPMAGDRTAWLRSRRSPVSLSGRVSFSQPGIQWQNYGQLGPFLPPSERKSLTA